MMKIIRRTSQGGSVAKFVLIGVVIFVALTGSLYTLNQRAQQVKKDQTIAKQKEQKNESKTTKSQEKVTVPESSVSDSKSNDTSSETGDLPATGQHFSYFEYIGLFFVTSSVIGYVLSRQKSAFTL